MNKEQLVKGTELEQLISETKTKLDRCRYALESLENGKRDGGGLYLFIPNVPFPDKDYGNSVKVIISDEQMTYALILAEKKIKREFDTLTAEFKEL